MKKRTAAGLALTWISLLFATRRGKPGVIKELRESRLSAPSVADQTAERYMMYVIMPAWLAVGFLDWLWHRQTKIEKTSGLEESLTHQLMMIEAGVPVFAALFLEANAGLLTLLTAGMVLHQVTAIWDVNYTVSRRKIPAREQHTHTFMETIPFDIWAVFACLHPQQFRSILGLGPDGAEFHLRFKRPPLSMGKIIAIVGSATLFVALPHAEEFWRCWRARQQDISTAREV